MNDEYRYAFMTPIGFIQLTSRDACLTGIAIRPTAGVVFPGDSPGESPVLANPVLACAAEQIEQYFSGCRKTFQLPLDLARISLFTRRVLDAVRTVKFGERITYGELATMIGTPLAARAVGRALAANPFPLVIPCHRVIAADGSLGGYSGGDGPRTKAWLLDFERSEFQPCQGGFSKSP